jgi:hypothetical protein
MIQPTKNSLPVLDPAAFTILDFELAHDGLAKMTDAGSGIMCQPRATRESDQNYFPGANFIADIVEGWLDWQVSDLIERLRSIRFDDAEDDDRRVRLLLRFELDNPGMAVPELVALALDQSVRSAA